jgi:hypothetical protein
MRRFLQISAGLLGFVLLLHGLAFLFIESGEVVVLRTDASRDHRFLARLWVVDHAGRPWVGTANPSKTKWATAIRESPRIELTRGDTTDCRIATFVDDPVLDPELSQLVNTKYRIPLYGSRFLKLTQGFRIDDVEAVWFRLDPCPAG